MMKRNDLEKRHSMRGADADKRPAPSLVTGEPMNDSGGAAVFTIRFPATLASRLREVAGRDYRTVGSLVRKLVAKGLEEERTENLKG